MGRAARPARRRPRRRAPGRGTRRARGPEGERPGPRTPPERRPGRGPGARRCSATTGRGVRGAPGPVPRPRRRTIRRRGLCGTGRAGSGGAMPWAGRRDAPTSKTADRPGQHATPGERRVGVGGAVHAEDDSAVRPIMQISDRVYVFSGDGRPLPARVVAGPPFRLEPGHDAQVVALEPTDPVDPRAASGAWRAPRSSRAIAVPPLIAPCVPLRDPEADARPASRSPGQPRASSSSARAANACMFATRSSVPVSTRSATIPSGPATATHECPTGSP